MRNIYDFTLFTAQNDLSFIRNKTTGVVIKIYNASLTKRR